MKNGKCGLSINHVVSSPPSFFFIKGKKMLNLSYAKRSRLLCQSWCTRTTLLIHASWYIKGNHDSSMTNTIIKPCMFTPSSLSLPPLFCLVDSFLSYVFAIFFCLSLSGQPQKRTKRASETYYILLLLVVKLLTDLFTLAIVKLSPFFICCLVVLLGTCRRKDPSALFFTPAGRLWQHFSLPLSSVEKCTGKQYAAPND